MGFAHTKNLPGSKIIPASHYLIYRQNSYFSSDIFNVLATFQKNLLAEVPFLLYIVFMT